MVRTRRRLLCLLFVLGVLQGLIGCFPVQPGDRPGPGGGAGVRRGDRRDLRARRPGECARPLGGSYARVWAGFVAVVRAGHGARAGGSVVITNTSRGQVVPVRRRGLRGGRRAGLASCCRSPGRRQRHGAADPAAWRPTSPLSGGPPAVSHRHRRGVHQPGRHRPRDDRERLHLGVARAAAGAVLRGEDRPVPRRRAGRRAMGGLDPGRGRQRRPRAGSPPAAGRWTASWTRSRIIPGR